MAYSSWKTAERSRDVVPTYWKIKNNNCAHLWKGWRFFRTSSFNCFVSTFIWLPRRSGFRLYFYTEQSKGFVEIRTRSRIFVTEYTDLNPGCSWYTSTDPGPCCIHIYISLSRVVLYSVHGSDSGFILWLPIRFYIDMHKYHYSTSFQNSKEIYSHSTCFKEQDLDPNSLPNEMSETYHSARKWCKSATSLFPKFWSTFTCPLDCHASDTKSTLRTDQVML